MALAAPLATAMLSPRLHQQRSPALPVPLEEGEVMKAVPAPGSKGDWS